MSDVGFSLSIIMPQGERRRGGTMRPCLMGGQIETTGGVSRLSSATDPQTPQGE